MGWQTPENQAIFVCCGSCSGCDGERIKQARLQAGLQQFEVAKRCGVSRYAVSAWELGQGIRSQKLIDYARVVGVSAEWLITGERTAATERTATADLDLVQLQRLAPEDLP
jgi:transcriptional regulator with XRE-family HTH domain